MSHRFGTFSRLPVGLRILPMHMRRLPVFVSVTIFSVFGLTHCDDVTDENPLTPPCQLEETPAAPITTRAATMTMTQMNHIIVLFLENHSYDNLYGELEGGDGLGKARPVPQQDTSGSVYMTLPQPMNTDETPSVPDDRFPVNLRN